MLLGSGELGKEFTIAAKRAGQYVIACDKYDNAPAMQVADEREVFSMLDGDALTAVVEKHHPDIIVPEIEAIRTERLFDFEKEGIQVVPSARAVNYTMNRRAIRDLAAKELGLRTAKYFYAKTFEEFKNAADEIGFPCVVKPLMSSSGHGQSYVHNDDELKEAYKEAMEEAIANVKTGQITYAIKDTSIDGKEIHAGDYMGLFDKDIEIIEKDKMTASKQLIEKMMDEDSEIVTLLKGEDATQEECDALAEFIEENYDVDVDVQDGGQPVYSFVIGVE